MTTTWKAVLSVSFAVIALSLVSVFILDKYVETNTDGARENGNAPIRVSVFNGCGRSGLASMFSEMLRDKEFDVVNGFGENADSFDFDVSVVIDRRGKEREKAETVAKTLGISVILEQRSDDPYLIEDVAVILGRDWNMLFSSKEVNAD